MFPRFFLLAALAVLGGLPLTAQSASAGWITITNDTNMVIVIQDSGDGKKIGKAKLIRLLPGETHREFQLGAGDKKIQIFEMNAPKKPLFEGPMKWKAEDLSLSVQPDGQAVKLGAPVPPANPVKPVVHR
jgi:hypothetical protein